MSNVNDGMQFKIWHDPSTGSDKAISWKDGDVYKTDDVTTASETVGGTGWYKMPSGKKYLIVPTDYTLDGKEGDAEIIYSLASSYSAGQADVPITNPFGVDVQVDCIAEVYSANDSKWGIPGWIYSASADDTYGVVCHGDDGSINLVFGTEYLISDSAGNTFTTSEASASVRIWIKEW